MRIARFFALLAVAATALAPALASAEVPENPTFHKDIEPIFQRSCQVCHRPNKMAPMSLTTYEEARPWARAIRSKVMARDMPPWHLDKTTGVQWFVNYISLSDEQIATIVAWVDAGAPLGDRAQLLAWAPLDALAFGEVFEPLHDRERPGLRRTECLLQYDLVIFLEREVGEGSADIEGNADHIFF